MRTTCSTLVTNILPSPIFPVRAALITASMARSTNASPRMTSTLTLGRKSTTYSAPRYNSVCPFWRPNPFTSVTVRPVTPSSDNASRTSSSLNGLMIASTFFIAILLAQPCKSCQVQITLAADALPLGPRRRDRIAPVLAESARRDADAHRRLPALVLVDLDQPDHLGYVLRRVTKRHDGGRTQVFLDVGLENGI